MAFDIKTAIPAKETETEPAQRKTAFDLTTAKPIQPDQVDADVPALAPYLKFKFRKGHLPIARGSYGREAMWGRLGADEALSKGNKAYLEQLESAGKLEDITFKDAPVKFLLGEAAELVPFMLGATKEGLKQAATVGGGFAAITAAAGQIPPFTFLPEEAITVPSAFASGVAIGFPFGIIKYSLDFEGGNLFLDMIDAGVKEETARPLSLAGGTLIGVIEMMQLNLLSAPFKRLFTKTLATKTARNALVGVLKNYLKVAGGEIVEEELQEIVQLSTQALAGMIDQNPNVIPTSEEWSERLVMVAKKAAPGLAVLALPGAAVDLATIRKNIRQDIQAEPEAAVEEKLPAKAVIPPKKAVPGVPPRPVEAIEPEVAPEVEKPEIVEIEEGFRGTPPTGISFGATEGRGVYIAKNKDLAEFFAGEKGKVEIVRFKKPKKPLNVFNEPLPLLQDEFPIFEEIKDSDSEWIKFNKQAVKNVGATEQNWGKTEDAVADELTKLMKEKGYDAVHIKQDTDEWVVILDKNLLLPEAKPAEVAPKIEPSIQFKQRLEQIEQELKTEKAKTKREVRVVQEEIIKQLEISGLEAKDKAKFIRAIKNVQTAQQLEKALPEIKARIAKLAETAERKALITDIKSETKKSKIKKLRPEFRDKIVPLVESIDLVKRKEATIKNLESLAEFIEREPENQIPQKRLNELKILGKKPIGELTTENLQTISDSINHFVRLNELKNKLIIKGKLREAREITNKAVDNVGKKHEQLNESLSGLDSFQQERETSLWNRIFGVDSFNAEIKSEILDGADRDIIMRVVYNEIDDGVAKELKFKHSAEDFFKEKLEGIDMDRWSHSFQTDPKKVDKIKIEISGDRTIAMTRGEAIAFNLQARNANNRRHLKNGGFAFSKTPSKINKLTEEDINKLADSVKGKMLTVADAMHEHYNVHQKRAINKVSVDLLGHEVAVEPDYFPIRTDFLDRFKDELIKTGNYSQRTLEGLGMFKERQAASNAIILEDAFVATHKSIKSAGAYIGLAKALRGAKTLLNNNDFQIAARNAGLNHYIESLKAYIGRVEGDSIRMDNVDKLTQDLINRLDVAILGPNPFVWFKQPISYMAAATEMDIKYLKKGRLKNAATKAEIEEMRKFSPHLRDRLDGNVTREAGEIAQVGRVKRFFTGKEVLSAKFMVGLRKGDLRAITGIWRGIKAEVSEKSPKLKGDEFLERVAERAWEVTRRTQPTFHIKDRSTIGMSRNVFIRLLTKYSSQRNKNWMIVRRAFERYNRSAKTGKDKAALAKALTIISIISPLFLMAIDELREKIYGKKEDKRSLLRQLTTKYITLNFGNIYFLGTGVNSLISKIDRGTYAGYDVNNPLTSMMDDIIDTVANAIRSIEQSITGERFKAGKDKGEKKWIASLKKSAIGALDTAGKIKGVGIHTVRKIITGIIKLVYPELKTGRPKIGR